MGLSSELSCEAGSFSQHLNSHRCFQSEVLRLYFPMLEPWVVQSLSFPSCSSLFICLQMWDRLLCQSPPCCDSSPPMGLDECFFFKSSVVGLPYSSIFWQFWMFFVFKFVVVLFWLCEEAKCIYLYLHLGQKIKLDFSLLFVSFSHLHLCLFSIPFLYFPTYILLFLTSV